MRANQFDEDKAEDWSGDDPGQYEDRYAERFHYDSELTLSLRCAALPRHS